MKTMKTFSYKKAGLLLLALGLFSSPSYARGPYVQQPKSTDPCNKYHNNIATAMWEDDMVCAKNLVLSGADVNKAHSFVFLGSVEHLIPLFIAVKKQDIEFVKLLVQHKADPFLPKENPFSISPNLAINLVHLGTFVEKEIRRRRMTDTHEKALLKYITTVETKYMRTTILSYVFKFSKEWDLINRLEIAKTEKEYKVLVSQLGEELKNGPSFNDLRAGKIYKILYTYTNSYNRSYQKREQLKREPNFNTRRGPK